MENKRIKKRKKKWEVIRVLIAWIYFREQLQYLIIKKGKKKKKKTTQLEYFIERDNFTCRVTCFEEWRGHWDIETLMWAMLYSVYCAPTWGMTLLRLCPHGCIYIYIYTHNIPALHEAIYTCNRYFN